MEIKIKKLHKDAVVPQKATKGAAAYDVYNPHDNLMIQRGRSIIPLDIAMEIPHGYEAHVQPRSGYSSKGFEGFFADDENTLMRFDCDVLDGKIDSDYRGNIGVIVNNRSGDAFCIKKGTRIAQLTIRKVEDVDFVEAEELSDTLRGDGGFGHTNEK